MDTRDWTPRSLVFTADGRIITLIVADHQSVPQRRRRGHHQRARRVRHLHHGRLQR